MKLLTLETAVNKNIFIKKDLLYTVVGRDRKEAKENQLWMNEKWLQYSVMFNKSNLQPPCYHHTKGTLNVSTPTHNLMPKLSRMASPGCPAPCTQPRSQTLPTRRLRIQRWRMTWGRGRLEYLRVKRMLSLWRFVA